MDHEVLAILSGAIVLLLLICGGGAVFLMKGRVDEAKVDQAPQQAHAVPAAAPRRGAAAARRRRQQAAQNQEEDAGQEGEEGNAPERAAPQPGFSRKDAYEERRRKREEEREALQLAEEAEQARKDAERQAAEDAEAAKWLGQISTEQEGSEALDSEEQQGMLTAFVDHIKAQKTVVLEDLAADFNLRVQDVIARVQTLESEGRITGIMDDRGKFIFISQEEMQAVADFIKARGRVSIAELAAKSNTFIDLEQKKLAQDGEMQLDLDFEDEESGI